MTPYELAALLGASSPILRPFAQRAAWLVYRLLRPWVDRKAADLAGGTDTSSDRPEVERAVAGLADALFPESPAGADLPSLVVHWKARNTTLVLVRAAEIMDRDRIEVREVPRSWLMPLLEAAGNVEGANLREMWARLLASGVAEDEHQHPMWVHTLAQMSAEDAQEFQRVCTRTDHRGIAFLSADHRFYGEVDAPTDQAERLIVLGLVHPTSVIADEQGEVTTVLSRLGAQFRRAVMPRQPTPR